MTLGEAICTYAGCVSLSGWLHVFFLLINLKAYFWAFLYWPTWLPVVFYNELYYQFCSYVAIPVLKAVVEAPASADLTSWRFWVILLFFGGAFKYLKCGVIFASVACYNCFFFFLKILIQVALIFLKILFLPMLLLIGGLELLSVLLFTIYSSIATVLRAAVSLAQFVTVYLFSVPFSMYPELILVITIFVAVGCFAYARSKYNHAFLYRQLIRAFGYEAVIRVVNFGSYEHNMLIRFHNSRRQLTAVIYAWRALVIGVVFSLWWFIKQFGFIYSISARNSMWEPNSPAVQPMVVGHSDAWFGLHFYHDSFTFGSRLFILFLFLLFLIIVRNEFFNESRLSNIEFLILYTFGAIFCMLMVSSFSLVSLFLSAEGLVMTMYLLTASGIYYKLFSKYIETELSGLVRYRSLEGSLKYSIFNILSTFFLLFGSILLFAFSKASFFFSTLAIALGKLSVASSFGLGESPSLLLGGLFIGLFCLCLSFFFKLGLFPFSSWVADLYDSTLSINMVYFLIIPKAAIMLGFINLYRFLFVQFHIGFFIICFVFGFISIIFGSISAINQQRIARVLAYSSVTYAGMFVMLTAICFMPSVKLAHLSVVFVIAYMFVLLFFLVIYMALRYSPYYFTYTYINQFRLAHFRPKSLQLLLVNSLFSLSGIPPLLGWVLKFVFLIALVKLFSVALFDFYHVSSLIPIDLFVNFFQKYDAYSITTNYYLLEKGLHDQLVAICAPGNPHYACTIGGQPGRVIGTPITDTSFFNQPFFQDDKFYTAAKPVLGWYQKFVHFVHWAVSAPMPPPPAEELARRHDPSFWEWPVIVFSQTGRLLFFNDTSQLFLYLKSSTWFVVIFFVLLFVLFLVTVLSTFYYLRILKSIYAAPKHSFLYFNQNTGNINVSFSMTALVLFLGIINVLGLVFFQIFNNWIFLVFCVNAIGF